MNLIISLLFLSIPTLLFPAMLENVISDDTISLPSSQIQGKKSLSFASLPEIALLSITGEQTGRVVLDYDLYNPSGKLVTLKCFYSDNSGVSWTSATVSGVPTAGINETSYSGRIFWYSSTDLPGIDKTTVRFKLVPYENGTQEGVADKTTDLHLDNNQIPTVNGLNILSTFFPGKDYYSGELTFQYQLDDTEKDVLQTTLFYSTNTGITWQIATVTSTVTGLNYTNYTGSFTWFTNLDLPDISKTEVKLKLVPYDNDEGVSKTIDLPILNNVLPKIEIQTPPDSLGTENVTINYRLSDIGNDILEITCEYSTDTGKSFNSAFIKLKTNIASTNYISSVTWVKDRDLPELFSGEVIFRITPRDELDIGKKSDTAPFQVYVPIALPKLQGTAISPNTINWEWNDISQVEQGYKLKLVSLINGTTKETIIADLPANTTYYIQTGLLANTLYTVNLEVYNEQTKRSTLPIAVYTLAKIPKLTTINQSVLNVPLSWVEIINPVYTSYILYRSTPNTTWDLLTTTTDTQYIDLEITDGVTYFYQIYVKNQNNIISGPSNTQTVYIEPLLPEINSPTHPDTNIPYVDNTIILNWNVPENQKSVLKGYYYKFNTVQNFQPDKTSNFTSSEKLTLNEVIDGTWYFHLKCLYQNDKLSNFTVHYSIKILSKIFPNKETVLQFNDGTVITIPSGTLVEENRLELSKPGNIPTLLYDTTLKPTKIIRHLQLEKPIESFIYPITISITYSDMEIEGVDETKLYLFYENNKTSTWQLIPDVERQADKNIITAKIKKTGLYRILEYTLPIDTIYQLTVYPNPFIAGGTPYPGKIKIRYTLNQTNKVTLSIYDLTGGLVFNQDLYPGDIGTLPGPNEIFWDGKDTRGNYIPTGIYICRVGFNGKSLTTHIGVK